MPGPVLSTGFRDAGLSQPKAAWHRGQMDAQMQASVVAARVVQLLSPMPLGCYVDLMPVPALNKQVSVPTGI